MKLTVLGKSPAWQDAGGACSGYLIEDEQTLVLLECGNGVFAKLRVHAEYDRVAAVVISHMHADHFLDLVPFSYALTLSPRGRQAREDERPRPLLIAPPGGRATIRNVVGSWGSESLVETAFELAEYDPDETVAVGSLRFRFLEVPHFTRTFAVEVTSASDGGRITHGADCRANDALIEFARDTDLLMVEATLDEPDPDPDAGHMTPAEAGELGRRAGAARVVLTHISDEIDSEWALREGSAAFGGSLEIAQEGAAFTV